MDDMVAFDKIIFVVVYVLAKQMLNTNGKIQKTNSKRI
jgi:hypothetical protein